MLLIENFIRDIDRNWLGTQEGKIALKIIGSTALMLQTDYARGTKDSDALETIFLSEQIKNGLRELAGRDTELHKRHKIYLDIVPSGLPFLPQAPLWHSLDELNATLSHFTVAVLDIVDVVVSKLSRFHANDRSDIQAMVTIGLVDHRRLIARFRSAVDAFDMDARVAELPKYRDNLHRVELDQLFVPETDIDLPDWG